MTEMSRNDGMKTTDLMSGSSGVTGIVAVNRTNSAPRRRAEG